MLQAVTAALQGVCGYVAMQLQRTLKSSVGLFCGYLCVHNSHPELLLLPCFPRCAVLVEFSGECSRSNCAKLLAQLSDKGVDYIIGFGGVQPRCAAGQPDTVHKPGLSCTHTQYSLEQCPACDTGQRCHGPLACARGA
jgi:hypothetical protein